MKEIFNVEYAVDMGSGTSDQWRIVGCVNGRNIFTGTPKSCDPDNDTFTTKSGSVYKVMSYKMSKEAFFAEVKKDIERGGTFTW